MGTKNNLGTFISAVDFRWDHHENLGDIDNSCSDIRCPPTLGVTWPKRPLTHEQRGHEALRIILHRNTLALLASLTYRSRVLRLSPNFTVTHESLTREHNKVKLAKLPQLPKLTNLQKNVEVSASPLAHCHTCT